MSQRRALILLTSHAEKGETGEATGFFWEEFATPYWRLRDSGFQVELASVQGGAPPADPISEPKDGEPKSVQRFLDDPEAMAALRGTASLDQVSAAGYDLVYLPGGHGAMWDLGRDERVGRLVAQAYENGAVVAAVCHGPAGLLTARLSDGTPLVQGKRVNGFTNSEEAAVGLDSVVPFLLADELKRLGGQFERSQEDFAGYAVRDGRLVTGQNPPSSDKVAEAIMAALA